MVLDMVSVLLRLTSGMSLQPYVPHKGVRLSATRDRFSDRCGLSRSRLKETFIPFISCCWVLAISLPLGCFGGVL